MTSRLDKSYDTIVIRDVANQTSNEEQYQDESAYLSSITSFYCNKCGIKFDKFWKLHEHIFNSDDHLFRCSKCCDNVGYTVGEVISHIKEICGWSAFCLEEARLETRTFWYYCDKCGKGFKTFRAFVPHYITHKADSINCICCNFKPRSVQGLLIHLKYHFVAENIELDCQVCSLQFHALYPYQQHYLIVHSQLANIPFKCSICSEVIFDDVEKFTWHLQKHSDIVRKRKELARNNPELNKTTCEICSKIFPTVEECEKHRAELHLLQNNVNFKKICRICTGLFNGKDISSHLRCYYKEANQNIKLLSLNKALVKQQLYSKLKDKEDKNMKLKGVSADKPEKISAKEYIVSERDDGSDSDICIISESELQFIETGDNSDTVYKSVLRKKREIRKLYCNKCGKLFADFWKLHIHIFNSPGDHDFECTKCYTKFKNYVEFSNHLRRYCTNNFNVKREKKQGLTHSNYFCEICGKGFAIITDFEKHCSKHHLNVKLCCSLCSYHCSSFEELLDHSMIHTVIGKIDLVCQICALHFYSPIPFKSHHYLVHSQLQLIPLKCCLCSVIIMDDEDKFISHVQSHGDLTKSNRRDVTKRTCEICGDILKSVLRLKMHKLKHHSNCNQIKKHCPFCLQLIHFYVLSFHMKRHLLLKDVRACLICKSTFTSQFSADRHICINSSVSTNMALLPTPKPQTITSSAESSNSANVLMQNLQLLTNANLALLPTPQPQRITSSAEPSNSANLLMKNLQLLTNANLALLPTPTPQTITPSAEPSSSANVLMQNLQFLTNANSALLQTPQPQTITSSAEPSNSANVLMQNLQFLTNANSALLPTPQSQTITSSAEPSNSANLLMKNLQLLTNANLALLPTPTPQTITSSAEPSSSANLLMQNLQFFINANLALLPTPQPQIIASSAESSSSANLLMKNLQLLANTNLTLLPSAKPQTEDVISAQSSNLANQLMKNLQIPINTNSTLPSAPQTAASSGLSYKQTFTGDIKCQNCNMHFESMAALEDHMKEH